MLKKAKIFPLKEIKTSSGNVIKFLDKKKKYFIKFGEVYFSEIKKGHVKGWNLHKKCHCLITVPFGSVEFTLMDYKMKKKRKFVIKRKKPEVLTIPPKIWFKFKSLTNYSVIANLIDQIHDKKETQKKTILR